MHQTLKKSILKSTMTQINPAEVTFWELGGRSDPQKQNWDRKGIWEGLPCRWEAWLHWTWAGNRKLHLGPAWVAGAQVLESSSAPFPDVSSGLWIRSGRRNSNQHSSMCRQLRPSPPCHRTNPATLCIARLEKVHDKRIKWKTLCGLPANLFFATKINFYFHFP